MSAVSASVAPMVPASFRVERVHRETHDVFSLELVPAGGGEGLSFRPGQFTMLYRFGVGEVPISISGHPGAHALVHTIRSMGSVTQRMADLQRGDAVGVRGPFGSCWPLQEAKGKDLLIMAGGIGLAPVRPILYHVLEQRDDYGRVCLLYGTRTPRDIIYRHEMERWRSHLDLDIEVTVDSADADWHGRVGLVTNLAVRASFDPGNAVAMICGPEIMMRFSVMALERQGMAKEAIYVSLERNMRCAVGHCGHCQFGPHFVCKDGPVFRFDAIEHFFDIEEF